MKRRLVCAAWAAALLLVPQAGHTGKNGKNDPNGTISGKVEAKKKKYKEDTVVYLEKAAGTFKPPAKPVVMGQKDSTFVPKVLVVLRGTTVEYTNSDPTNHSVYSPDGEKFDLGQWGQGTSKSRTYSELGAYTQLCRLHPMMLAHVIVVQNPYYAKANKQGEFEIKDVPPGKYTVRAWNQRLSADPVEIEVKAGGVTTATIPLHR
jgi:plastocyanin